MAQMYPDIDTIPVITEHEKALLKMLYMPDGHSRMSARAAAGHFDITKSMASSRGNAAIEKIKAWITKPPDEMEVTVTLDGGESTQAALDIPSEAKATAEIEVSDLGVAAAHLAYGDRLVQTTDGERINFIIETGENQGEFSSRYWGRHLPVDACAMFEAVRKLKSIIWKIKNEDVGNRPHYAGE